MGVSPQLGAFNSDLPEADPAPGIAVPGDQEAEARLIDAAVGGDAAAFAALYDRHADRVYRHCYYRLGNRADAEDITQQTFLQAWKAIGRYRRGGAPFVAWLLTIAQRLAISHVRRAREFADPEVAPAASEASDPAEAFGASVARSTVRRAILQLRPERQEVIILRFIEGFSVEEVAGALGKTENNIRVIQHRALADLRRRLADPATERAPHEESLGDRFRAAVAAALQRVTRRSHSPAD
jgi:RNA polymerase sigma-70 factor (ECF subfamily)